MAVRKVKSGVANVTNGNIPFIKNLSPEHQEIFRAAEKAIDDAVFDAEEPHQVDVTLEEVTLPTEVRDVLAAMYRRLDWSVTARISGGTNSTLFTL